MNQLSDPHPAHDYVLAAFEAGCGALRSLEAASAQIAQSDDERGPRSEHLTLATGLLRGAVSELRMAEDEDASLLGAAFVLAACQTARPEEAQG